MVSSGLALVTEPASSSMVSFSMPTDAIRMAASASVGPRRGSSTPKPHASTTGAMVMSKAPLLFVLTDCAARSTVRVSSERGKGSVEACWLKRDSSESSSQVDIALLTRSRVLPRVSSRASSCSGASLSSSMTFTDQVVPMMSPPTAIWWRSGIAVLGARRWKSMKNRVPTNKAGRMKARSGRVRGAGGAIESPEASSPAHRIDVRAR